ncbi:hypothetical protein [Halobaculum marinum]|uniref:Uncharacterized protein n=1 Tax=Halobaculum marinum TaxID=3031996 RepID=A0ABD5WQP7_9EURY|nr:hypothetical protein [Halobaculum sp. DT55]
MNERLVDELVKQKTPSWWGEREALSEDYFEEIGFEEPLPEHLQFHIHPLMGSEINWVNFFPSDTADRFRSEDEVSDVLSVIADRTSERIYSAIETEIDSDRLANSLSKYGPPSTTEGKLKGILWHKIVTQLSGIVDLEKVNKEVRELEEPRVDPTRESTEFFVVCQNEKNFLDIEVYTIEDQTEFFNNTYGDETLMFNKIQDSNIQPHIVAENVAFEVEGPSWYQSEPPEESIIYTHTDQRNRIEFHEIEDATVFGESWGDIDQMRQKLDAFDSEYIGSSSIDWWVPTGIYY